MIFILRCEKCNHLNGNVNGEVVRSNAVCECSCHDIPTDEVRPTPRAADGADTSAEVDPTIKAVNGMLDACVQPPRR